MLYLALTITAVLGGVAILALILVTAQNRTLKAENARLRAMTKYTT